MPQGLQTLDAAGNVIVDTSTWLPKAVTTIPDVTTPGSASVTAPAGSTIVAVGTASGASFAPIVTVSGTTVSWAKPAGATNFRGAVEILVY